MSLTLKSIRAGKEKRRKLLERNLKRITKQLRDMGAIRLMLFGSYGQRQVTRHSDLDLIAVMPSTKTGREWMRKIYDEIERDVACDILAYTEEELQNTAPVSRFIRHALKTGRVVYEKGRQRRGDAEAKERQCISPRASLNWLRKR